MQLPEVNVADVVGLPGAVVRYERAQGLVCARQGLWSQGAIMGAVTIWRRPYRMPWPIRVMTGFIALVASAMACVLAAAFFIGVHWTVGPWERVPVVVFMACVLTFSWRLHRTALVISDKGVRVRWLLKTRTMRWPEVKGFRFDDDVLDVVRLWIDLADGQRVRAPVQQVYFTPYGSRVKDGGARLRHVAADKLLLDLDLQLQARRTKA
jgi:hypothetical protein